MKTIWLCIILVTGGALLAAAAGQAGEIHGTVINRTTAKPVPNIDLTLLSPTAGMVEVGSARADAQGQFTVSNNAIGKGPILIRATYKDVTFNTFVPPGQSQIDVDIYEISTELKTIAVPSRVIIFQPHGEKLIGMEEYSVQNDSQPPYAYFRSEGNFDFVIPENGKLGQVTTTTRMGMSVNQASIDKGKRRYAIAYAFRPGQTIVRLSYQLPYSGNSGVVKLPATYAGSKLLVVVPPGVTATGDGLTAQRQEQGMMVYAHDPLPVNGVLSVKLTGAGSPQAAEGGRGEGGAPAQEGNSRTQGPEVKVAPSRLDNFKWYLLGGIVALFAMGWVLLSRKQVVGPADEQAVVKQSKLPSQAEGARAVSVESVEKQVSVSLESLKDQVFRLELRRQAGTITDEEYANEKVLVERRLRELVRG